MIQGHTNQVSVTPNLSSENSELGHVIRVCPVSVIFFLLSSTGYNNFDRELVNFSQSVILSKSTIYKAIQKQIFVNRRV